MITNDQFSKLARDLEVYHGIFSKLWQMGRPISDSSIPTAAVKFDREGGFFSFHFNPDFYASLDEYNVKFVICHEALHVILNHGKRSIGLDPAVANIAMDIVINESLVSRFGFERGKILNENKFCWYDTILDGKFDPYLKNKSFEYYYDLMVDGIKDGISPPGASGGAGTVDVHGGFGSEYQDQIEDKLGTAIGELGDEETRKLGGIIYDILDDESKCNSKAGTGVGGLSQLMDTKKVPPKKKWETVIKKWSAKYLITSDKDTSQWVRTNRRFTTLDRDLMIPTDMEVEYIHEEKSRIHVIFFLDTSGSCIHLASRFFRAAKTLPPRRFEVQLCCFDVQVRETSLETGKIYGGGGTSFSILEDYVKSYQMTKQKNVDAVFVISDGFGDYINPENPKKWYWFLSENYRQYIPKESHIYDLSKFE